MFFDKRYCHLLLAGWCLTGVVLSSSGATAQIKQAQPPEVVEAQAPHPAFDVRSKYMTGDWGGPRRDLEESPSGSQASVRSAHSSPVAGGVSRKRRRR